MNKLLIIALIACMTDQRAIDQILAERVKKVDAMLAGGRITPYQYADVLMDEYENVVHGAKERIKQNEIKQHELYLEIIEPIIRRSA